MNFTQPGIVQRQMQVPLFLKLRYLPLCPVILKTLLKEKEIHAKSYILSHLKKSIFKIRIVKLRTMVCLMHYA